MTNTLFQYSHFCAVNHGAYDGDYFIRDIKTQGRWGLGTFNALDGELVVINNQYYHCSMGKVRVAHDDEKLAWAAVANVSPNVQQLTINHVPDLKSLLSIVTLACGSLNYPYVLTIQGLFQQIESGSVPPQTKPYPPMEQVIDNSFYFTTGPVEATLVGFYAPGFLYPLKAQGLHFHFVTNDLKQGGHVLQCQIARAIIRMQRLEKIECVLPKLASYQEMVLPITNTAEQSAAQFPDKLPAAAVK